ncbi:MAG: hypothetical protein HC804_05455 [Anaerolineae bacterium]|nr:hypothetical protein [Anaerolineae bacterium]
MLGKKEGMMNGGNKCDGLNNEEREGAKLRRKPARKGQQPDALFSTTNTDDCSQICLENEMDEDDLIIGEIITRVLICGIWFYNQPN